MDATTSVRAPLGRTGLVTSRAGLGCGGRPRLGLRRDLGEAHAASLVTLAFDLGVNLIDTAATYGTEPAVGRALRELPRDELILSTKAGLWRTEGDPPPTGADIVASLHASLERLGTDRVELFHLHGLTAAQWPLAESEIVPALERERDAGRIRHLAVSEHFNSDPGHEMFGRSLPADRFDVAMVGFNILNQTARETVFPRTIEARVGTLIMFAVRDGFSDPAALRTLLDRASASGELHPESLTGPVDDPLAPFRAAASARTNTELAYRFCAHEPGCDVVLTGTSRPEHLRENVAAINAPPLPGDVTNDLRRIFSNVRTLTAQRPKT
ncbi:MAG: aldo/keto reductase [Planctomycetota bacterium]